MRDASTQQLGLSDRESLRFIAFNQENVRGVDLSFKLADLASLLAIPSGTVALS
jgi:hypothetical protein